MTTTAPTLAYTTLQPKRDWRRLALFVTLGVLAVVVAYAALRLPARNDVLQFDGVSGARRVTTYWPMGFTTVQETPNALRERLDAMDGPTPQWQTVSSIERSLVGFTLARGCNCAPSTAALDSLTATELNTLDDAEVLGLVETMSLNSVRHTDE